MVALVSTSTYLRPIANLASVASCLARSYTLPYWQVTRAQMVLMAADGLRNDEIAQRLNCRREVVCNGANASSSSACRALRTVHGAAARRLFPLTYALRSSRWPARCRPSRAGRAAIALVLKRAGTRAVTREIVEQVSGVTVRRWLSQDAIKPWQHRSWIFRRDPRFAERAGPILDLYAGHRTGRTPAPRRLRHLRRREALDPRRAGARPRRCPRAEARVRRANTNTSARTRCATSRPGTRGAQRSSIAAPQRTASCSSTRSSTNS